MKFYFFRQNRNKLKDKRLFNRSIREFKVEAQTEDLAIQKFVKKSMTTQEIPVTQDSIPFKLSQKDIRELFEIHEYNFAIHGNVPDLKEMKFIENGK